MSKWYNILSCREKSSQLSLWNVFLSYIKQAVKKKAQKTLASLFFFCYSRFTSFNKTSMERKSILDVMQDFPVATWTAGKTKDVTVFGTYLNKYDKDLLKALATELLVSPTKLSAYLLAVNLYELSGALGYGGEFEPYDRASLFRFKTTKQERMSRKKRVLKPKKPTS